MGLGSFLKKSIKNSFRGGSLWNMGVDKLDKQISGPIKEALGLNAFADIASGQQAALQAQQNAAKLQQANEVQNVVQFEDGGTNVLGSDQRRRKQPTGSYGAGIGLRV